MAKGRFLGIVPKDDPVFSEGWRVQPIGTQAELPRDAMRVSKLFFDADWNPCDESVAVYGRAFVRNEQGHVIEWQTVQLTREQGSALSSDERDKK